MSLLKFNHKFLPIIETALQDSVDFLKRSMGNAIRDMLFYHMGWLDKDDPSSHGKRLRPLLMLLCVEAFDEDIQKALPGAVSIELLHNFTLIHDDIEDRSSLRHGRPTLWKKWGIPQAINTGDSLFSIAQMSMLNLRKTCDERIATESAHRLNDTCLQLTRGQQMDLSFENEKEIGVADYLEMVQGKTAALISLSTNLSGLITKQSIDVQESLADFGENLGMAFQIQDDGLGIWGDPQITGKSVASDIQSHKKTLPILYGLEQSDKFRCLWEKEELHTAEEVAQMAQVLQECGAKGIVQTKTKAYTKKALTNFNKILPKKNDAAKTIIELTHNLLNRDL